MLSIFHVNSFLLRIAIESFQKFFFQRQPHRITFGIFFSIHRDEKKIRDFLAGVEKNGWVSICFIELLGEESGF